jgi:GR25 family glycosyltransferase involved in LPS biosynthesis
MKAFVINLDQDAGRWATLSVDLSIYPWLEVKRIKAVYGPDLPDLAVKMLAADGATLKRRGTLGTFLSHVKAWEAVVETSEKLSIVLEDDAVLLSFDRLLRLEFPADADLVFLNDRMSPGSRHENPRPPDVECLPILESVRKLRMVKHGVGGDGYILTQAGAAKLLRAVEADRLFGHVDWRLLRYSLSPEDLVPEFDDTQVGYVVRHHHNPNLSPAWAVVKAYCVSSPLVAFGTRATSSRDEADAAGQGRLKIS